MDLLPDDIRTIDDIVKLPFTTKADLRDNYPVGLLATPMSGDSPYPCLFRHDGQSHHRRLYLS